MPQIPFIDRVVDIPVASQRQVCIDLQKTVEIPQLQFLDLVVVPVCATTSLVQTVQKTVELPQVQLLWCVDVPVIILLVPAVQSYVSRAIQSDRVPDIPVMLTVQFLNKVVDMVMYDRVPIVRQCRVRSSTRSSTSLVQNSGSASDPVIDRARMTFLRRFWPIFRTPPQGVESRVARIFRAPDDEEFFVVEGSSGVGADAGSSLSGVGSPGVN